MNAAATLRALPVLFRIGFAEAVAYRAELFIWVLSTTMPLIMLALWTAVAREAPVGRYGQAEFVAYFLATFVTRQVTGSWISWQMTYEVRTGTLAMRLLRPLHPLLAFAIESLAVLPLRSAVSLPVAALALVLVGDRVLPENATGWTLWLVSMAGAWLITFLASFCIGCLAFYVESAAKVMELWLTLFFVLSGYMLPVELFPPGLRAVVDALPFRYQIGLPVELLTSVHPLETAVALLVRQWIWVVLLAVLARVLWRGGVRRFAAYGG